MRIGKEAERHGVVGSRREGQRARLGDAGNGARQTCRVAVLRGAPIHDERRRAVPRQRHPQRVRPATQSRRQPQAPQIGSDGSGNVVCRIDLDQFDTQRPLPVVKAPNKIAGRASGTRMRDGSGQARFGCLPPRGCGRMRVEPATDAAEHALAAHGAASRARRL
jgi:hypothetical protein